MRIHATQKAIGYARVSTQEQADSGLGIASQKAAIAACAASLSLELVAVYEDAGVSGTTAAEDRDGLWAALAALKRGYTLIVPRRDRLARSVPILVMLDDLIAKKGATLVSAAGEPCDTSDPDALLMRRIQDAISEHQRGLSASRTRAAMRALRRDGKRAGGIPYGFRLAESGKHLMEHPGEHIVAQRIVDSRQSGMTFRKIAAALNAEGYYQRNGEPWRPGTVYSVCEHFTRGPAALASVLT